MVHALEEIRRVLVQGGTLIDLRPLAEGWPVEVCTGGGREAVGRVTDLPQGLADDEAANTAMRQGEGGRLFTRDQELMFPFYYTWDSPAEMQEFIEQEWSDFAEIRDDVWKNARSAWTIAEAGARVGIRVNMLITRWTKRP